MVDNMKLENGIKNYFKSVDREVLICDSREMTEAYHFLLCMRVQGVSEHVKSIISYLRVFDSASGFR